jgi:hypothetical protein
VLRRLLSSKRRYASHSRHEADRRIAIVTAPGQGIAASGFIASTAANTKSSSKPAMFRPLLSYLHAAIFHSFSSGRAIPPFVSRLAFWNLMASNTMTPMVGSSNINMKTKMEISPSTTFPAF